jgi:glycosyltransferase involved in cell wall biosynthesis
MNKTGNNYNAFGGKVSLECDGYAGMYTALTRAQGIPCRIVYGRKITSGSSTWTEEVGTMEKNTHTWVEAWADGRWITIDPQQGSYSSYSTKKQWWMYFWIEKIASLFTDVIITINDEDYASAQKLNCKDVRKINGVGVDTDHYHDVDVDVNAYKRALGLPTEKIMVLSVGELSARKNHQIIIKALGSLQNKSDYIYVICGKEVAGGDFVEYLKSLADENGVALYLLGHRNDIPQIMHCSDIGAIPSVREGLGLAGIQSLCAEVPLVGTDVQGIKAYIIDDVSGYLCEPYDIKGYAEAIVKLSDPQLRETMKQNCYSIAKRFDSSISNRQMEEIYLSLLDERG